MCDFFSISNVDFYMNAILLEILELLIVQPNAQNSFLL